MFALDIFSPASGTTDVVVDNISLDIDIIRSLKKRNYWIGNYFKDINLPAHLIGQWDPFCSTWDDLDLDIFMEDGGKYRTRRFTEFLYTMSSRTLSSLVHAPFFQSKDLNKLNGGIQRKFFPITPFIAMHSITNYMIHRYCEMFFAITNHDTWHINFHQVRVSAVADMIGKPAPEGMHRDGVTFTALFCVKRENTRGAVNFIYDQNKKEPARVTLHTCGDCIILRDEFLYHDVTDMLADTSRNFAQRDMLFIEFSKY